LRRGLFGSNSVNAFWSIAAGELPLIYYRITKHPGGYVQEERIAKVAFYYGPVRKHISYAVYTRRSRGDIRHKPNCAPTKTD
jgi:hypothetical protein